MTRDRSVDRRNLDRLDRSDDTGVDEDRDLRTPELAPILQLLSAGAPTNGIDLEPSWRAELSRECETAAARSRPSPVRWFQAPARYAAVLVCGALIGVVATELASSPVEGKVSAAAPIPSSHYSDGQRDLMVAIIEFFSRAEQAGGGSSEPPRSFASASRELAGCIACHDRALRPLTQAASSPDAEAAESGHEAHRVSAPRSKRG